MNNNENDTVRRAQNADDLLRVAAVVGHVAEVAWSTYVQGRIDVVFPAGTKPEVVEAVARDIAALVPPVPHVGIRHPKGADCERPCAYCAYCATQKEADLRELAHHREHVARPQARGTELLEENRRLRAGGPAILQGMARAEAWKGMSTAEISERLTHQWEAMVAHGGNPEAPASPIPVGALLSPVKVALDAVKDRVPESVYIGLSAVILGAHRAAIATQERNEQRALDLLGNIATRMTDPDLNTEIQRRVDELLQGPRPAVYDCEGRRLREVLRSWIQNERDRPTPEPGPISSPDDRETILALHQRIDDLTRCLTSQAQTASMGVAARALLKKARTWMKCCDPRTPLGWRQFDLDVIAIDNFFNSAILAGTATIQSTDDPQLAATYDRIASLPRYQQPEALLRAARAFSVPESCIRYESCVRDGDDIVWPDGERYPTRYEGEVKVAS